MRSTHQRVEATNTFDGAASTRVYPELLRVSRDTGRGALHLIASVPVFQSIRLTFDGVLIIEVGFIETWGRRR